MMINNGFRVNLKILACRSLASLWFPHFDQRFRYFDRCFCFNLDNPRDVSSAPSFGHKVMVSTVAHNLLIASKILGKRLILNTRELKVLATSQHQISTELDSAVSSF